MLSKKFRIFQDKEKKCKGKKIQGKKKIPYNKEGFHERKKNLCPEDREKIQ